MLFSMRRKRILGKAFTEGCIIKREVPLLTTVNQFLEFYLGLYSNASIGGLIISTIGVLIYFLPMTLTILHYRAVRSNDYLLMAVMFFSMTINYLVLIPLYTDFQIFMEFDFVIFSVWLTISAGTVAIIFPAFALHAMRLKWVKPPSLFMYGNFLIAIILYLGIGVLPIIDSNTYFAVQAYIQVWMEAYRAGIGFIILYAYRTTERVIEHRTIKPVNIGWSSLGTLIMLHGIVGSMVAVLFIINPALAASVILLLYRIFPVFDFFILGQLIVLFYITVRYPASLLISEAQVLRACKIYAIVKTYPLKAQPHHMGMDHIMEYITKVPESMFEEGCQPYLLEAKQILADYNRTSLDE
jgi:hypothetical protein